MSRRGWYGQSRRHSLASKGVRTAVDKSGAINKVPPIIFPDIKLRKCSICGSVQEHSKGYGCLRCRNKDILKRESQGKIIMAGEHNNPLDDVSDYRNLSDDNLRKIRKMPITSLYQHTLKEKNGIRLSVQNTVDGTPHFFVKMKTRTFGTYNYGRATEKYYGEVLKQKTKVT